jgi:curved DNA-binding protein CbpA
MDPFLILGVPGNATQDEIKQAYRRLAMRWHPDRNPHSSEAKERFHQAAEAYKMLFEKKPGKHYDQAETDGTGYRQQRSSERSTHHDHDQYHDHSNDSQDEFADTVFWDVMLDFAIKLAQTGSNESQITLEICRNGCNENLARLIAEKAFNIHAHYASNPGSGKRGKPHPDHSSFKEERLQEDLFRAFIGQRSFFWSPRDACEYYLVVFRAFRQSSAKNPLNWISVNKRLLGLLNFSIVLFTVILLAVYYYSGPAEYKLLTDKQLLQLPFLVLPLMFVWMLYRKLWIASLVMSPTYLATIAHYNDSMPAEITTDLYAIIPTIALCFAPFVVTVLFVNFVYYQKAQRMIGQAGSLFSHHLDELVWIKNRSGTSATPAFLFALLFIVAMVHLFPRNWDFSGPVGLGQASVIREKNQAKLKKARWRVDEAREFFDIAESHFNASSPDYVKAEMAYITSAANGSLLALYKLGYMHYSGVGAEQNDALAFNYFQQATRAPLAFQPHDLEVTTRFLAESYNSLGILYQDGIGTRKNRERAAEMFRQAANFGAPDARRNLKLIYQGGSSVRRELANPMPR